MAKKPAKKSDALPVVKYTVEPEILYYTTDGSVRGECHHKHRTAGAAQACIDRDQYGCATQRGYSDRRIVEVWSDGTRTASRGEYDDLST